ncbi:MAG: tetratricopeptide repeat protein [Bacteroidetes bacterium]|nr:tetratricopeptide repeat protein [Bacteroidota bacterium]
MPGKHHQEDKLMSAYYKAVQYFEENKKNVYTALTILVVLIAGTILFVNKRTANNELAAVELDKVKMFYNSNNFKQAIEGDSLGTSKGLLYIVNEYGSTENGETAKLMLANSYYSLRDFDNAEKYYKDFSGSNKILKVSALAGLAGVYEAKNNYTEAAKQFEKAANYDNNNPFVDQYLFYAAKDYFRAGDYKSAKELFDNLKKDHPKSKFIAESERYKASMNN